MIEHTDEDGNTWVKPERPVHCYLCAQDWVPHIPDGVREVDCPNCGYTNEVERLFDTDPGDAPRGAL